MLNKLIHKLKSHPICLYLFFYFLFLFSLLFFRNPVGDEVYYLRETLLISELLKKGIWIGNYGVGLHGFLFKLPVALIYILIGKPSVLVATLFTILISIGSVYFFYKIVKRFFKEGNYAFWSTVIFSLMLQYVNMSISFNRDIPAIFTVLLFFYLFLNESKPWLIGLSFLLMLDAKEHIFLTVAPLYGVYIFINYTFFIKGISIWKRIKEIISKSFVAYILPLMWVIIMFTTSIIPVNMFMASISGLVNTGMAWNKSQFSTQLATQNLLEDETAKSIPSLKEFGKLDKYCNSQGLDYMDDAYSKGHVMSDGLICKILTWGDMAAGYIGKMLYPRTFSFISVPKIIVLPTIVFSISMFLKWFKKKDRRVMLPMILLFNVLVLIVRASHGRYLLCVTPLFALFFVMFVKEAIKKEKYFRDVLIGTTVFVLLGLYFESSFILPKIILEVSLLILFWSIWYFRKNTKLISSLKLLFLFALSSGMFLTNVAFFYSIGQISSYLKFGYNRETIEIVEQLPSEERVWINNYGSSDLIRFFRKDLYTNPEWVWHLAGWLPKKDLLKVYAEPNTYTTNITDIEEFRTQLKEKGINTVVMVVSTIEDEEFSDQEKLTDLLDQDWLQLEETLELKNKEVYIFKFIDK